MSRTRTWLRRGGIAVVALAMLAGVIVFAGDWLAARKMQRSIDDIVVQPLAYRDDAAAIERGRYLYASRGCADCHGAQGNGRMFVNDGRGLRIAGPNISPGPGNVVSHYIAADWVLAIRHGVNPQLRPLMVMPSEDFNRLTDEDLAAVIAYVRHMPPAPGGAAVLELPLPVRVLYGFGLMQDAAAKIDHTLPPGQPVPDGVTVEHGAYVANMCIGCHRATLAGGKIPGAPPEWPAAPRLAPGDGSVMPRYPDAGTFERMLRSGQRPDGAALQVMPFASLRQLNDTDVRALYLYLTSLKGERKG
ncbi:c-type cytochrome [Cupriavidus sp. 2TAF22]|uniref:c-type cytochrome n=1 Tax=unclassified Cupriavidus TaxID=2640874 RepID=UPI003F90212B